MIHWQLQTEDTELAQEFLATHPHRSVFQSPTWQRVLRSIRGVSGAHVVVGMCEGVCVGVAVVTVYQLPAGACWLHVGGGPLFLDGYQEEGVKTWTAWVNDHARSVGAVWTRIEPAYVDDVLGNELPKYWKNTSISYQPEASLWLDLEKSEEELLAEMKQKGRYNIRLSEKKGVTISMWQQVGGVYEQLSGAYTSSDPLGAFYRLFQETTARDGFSGRSQEYYATVLKELGTEGVLVLAVHEGDVLAGAICSMQNGVAVYLFGASTAHKRALMAPYLVQWAAITEAKKRGMRAYDFLGISPPNVPNHPWQHVTEFKTKFGGEVRVYLGAWMRVHRPLVYRLLQIVKWVRNRRR